MNEKVTRVEVVCYENDKVIETINGKHIVGIVLTSSKGMEAFASSVQYGSVNAIEELAEIRALEAIIAEVRKNPAVALLELLCGEDICTESLSSGKVGYSDFSTAE